MLNPIFWFCQHPALEMQGQGLKLQAIELDSELVGPIIAGLRGIFAAIPLHIPVLFSCERGSLSTLPSSRNTVPMIANALSIRTQLSEPSWMDLFMFRPEEVSKHETFLALHRYTIDQEDKFGKRNELRAIAGTSSKMYTALHELLLQESGRREIRFLAEEPSPLCWAHSICRDAWRRRAEAAFNGGALEESLYALSVAERHAVLAPRLRDKQLASELQPISLEVPEVQIVGFRGLSHRKGMAEELAALGMTLDARGEDDAPRDTDRPRDRYHLANCPGYETLEGRHLLLLDMIWRLYRAGQEIPVPSKLLTLTPEKVDEWVSAVARRWAAGNQNAKTRAWLDAV